MPEPVLPNFFLVGTGKAGTTSLHSYLGQHPDIFMSSNKEPCYFASEIRPANLTPDFQRHNRLQSRALPRHIHDGKPFDPTGWMVSTWEDYLRLFQEAGAAKIRGESSAAYLWSETAAANIRQRVPDARIAMILRDPAERAFSQYLHLASIGMVRMSFREHIEACARGGHRELSPLYPFLEIGLYHRQVQRFLDTFPREKIRIYWYEDDWRQPARLLADLFEFLEVDASFQPDFSRRDHERRAPRSLGPHYLLKKLGLWYPLRALVPAALRPRMKRLAFREGKSLRMEAADREYLVAYYREDILRLASLVDRDLSGWLR